MGSERLATLLCGGAQDHECWFSCCGGFPRKLLRMDPTLSGAFDDGTLGQGGQGLEGVTMAPPRRKGRREALCLPGQKRPNQITRHTFFPPPLPLPNPGPIHTKSTPHTRLAFTPATQTPPPQPLAVHRDPLGRHLEPPRPRAREPKFPVHMATRLVLHERARHKMSEVERVDCEASRDGERRCEEAAAFEGFDDVDWSRGGASSVP